MSLATASSPSWDSAPGNGLHLDLVVLDHGIREQLIPHPLRGGARRLFVGGGEGHHDLLAGAHLGDVMAEGAQRREDGLALRIAHLALRPDEHSRDESRHAGSIRKPAAAKSESNVIASSMRSWRITAKLVASTNEYGRSSCRKSQRSASSSASSVTNMTRVRGERVMSSTKFRAVR